MNYKIIRTDASHPDFVTLVNALDADLAQRDGTEHAFYDQFNKVSHIGHAVVAYENGTAVACGALKEYAPGIMEVKRMYTLPQHRGKGVAAKVLNTLEAWAQALGCGKCILETGKRQPEAIRLYEKAGYVPISNYGQYAGVANSVCFEKKL